MMLSPEEALEALGVANRILDLEVELIALKQTNEDLEHRSRQADRRCHDAELRVSAANTQLGGLANLLSQSGVHPIDPKALITVCERISDTLLGRGEKA